MYLLRMTRRAIRLQKYRLFVGGAGFSKDLDSWANDDSSHILMNASVNSGLYQMIGKINSPLGADFIAEIV
jgi:hypothetical protein